MAPSPRLSFPFAFGHGPMRVASPIAAPACFFPTNLAPSRHLRERADKNHPVTGNAAVMARFRGPVVGTEKIQSLKCWQCPLLFNFHQEV